MQAIALSDSQAPGGTTGLAFASFGIPLLNNRGQTAFTATLAGTNVDSSNDAGVWSNGFGELDIVARENDVAPGGDTKFRQFEGLRLNDQGRVAFMSLWPRPDPPYQGIVTGQGIYSNRDGIVAPVVRSLDPDPSGQHEERFVNFDPSELAFNNAGDIAFGADVYGSGPYFFSRTGIWKSGSNGLEKVARYGDPAVGWTAIPYCCVGASLTTPRYAALNESGEVTFSSWVNNNTNKYVTFGVWSERDGGLKLSPSTFEKRVWTYPLEIAYRPLLDESGEISYVARLHGSEDERPGIVAERDGTNVILMEGSGDRPWDAYETYGSFSNFSLGETVAFSGSWVRVLDEHDFWEPNVFRRKHLGYGVWSEFTGQLERIAFSGTHPPGIEETEDIVFNYLEAAFNDSGRTALLATLSGAEIDESNDTGLWWQNDLGALELLARSGEPMLVAPGEFRTVASLAFAGQTNQHSGLSGAFNDRGQLVFRATFVDGSSGVFLYSPVPEPAALLLAIVAWCVFPFVNRLPRARG